MNFAAAIGVRLSLLAMLMVVALPAAGAVGSVAEQARERGVVMVPLEPPPLTFGPGVDVDAAQTFLVPQIACACREYLRRTAGPAPRRRVRIDCCCPGRLLSRPATGCCLRGRRAEAAVEVRDTALRSEMTVRTLTDPLGIVHSQQVCW
jgi:hypothetical protein